MFCVAKTDFRTNWPTRQVVITQKRRSASAHWLPDQGRLLSTPLLALLPSEPRHGFVLCADPAPLNSDPASQPLRHSMLPESWTPKCGSWAAWSPPDGATTATIRLQPSIHCTRFFHRSNPAGRYRQTAEHRRRSKACIYYITPAYIETGRAR